MPEPAPDAHATFGALLRYLRRRARLTQQELGIAVGYSESYITRLENDSRAPVPSMVEARFVDALQLQREPQLAQQLLRLARSAHPPAQGTAATQAATNLRPQLTRFIGRARELAEVRRLLASQRLVTLTGPGGVGKTRLSQEAAAGLLEHFVDGVWLIELAPLSDPALIARSIASLLKLPNQMAILSAETLAGHLASRHMLLILDNCEHLIQTCAELAETLLLNCPHLNILATSREALHIPGEVAWPVPSLETGESVGLFADRAVAVRPEFTVTAQNAGTVAAIGARLDGMPLAIELAASRLSGLSLEQLAARLDDRFRLLTGGMRTALPRHQTLRALIDWSHQLLTDQERVLFRRLAVFVGGWTTEAAERVCAAAELDTHATLHAPNVLPLLLNLVSKSLVLAETCDGETRYRMLETIREYALEQLTAFNEIDAFRQRHAQYFLDFLKQYASDRYKHHGGPVQFTAKRESQPWFKRIDPDRANLLGALRWCLTEQRDVSTGTDIALWLIPFWTVRGPRDEGALWLTRALDCIQPLGPTITKAKVMCGLVDFEHFLNRPDLAAAHAQEALAICREQGSPFEIMIALLRRAGAGDLPIAAARALVEEWLALAQQLQDSFYEGIALFSLGIRAMQEGNVAEAARHYQNSLAALADRNEPTWHIAAFYQADALWKQGDTSAALVQANTALTIFRDGGFVMGVATVLQWLGSRLLLINDLERAREHLAEGLQIAYQDSARFIALSCLPPIAALAAVEGRSLQAWTLWTATRALSPGANAAEHEAPIAAAGAQFSAGERDSVEHAARGMSFDQAVAYALAECIR